MLPFRAGSASWQDVTSSCRTLASMPSQVAGVQEASRPARSSSIASRRLCSFWAGGPRESAQSASVTTYLSTPQSFSAVRGFWRGLWKWVSVWLWETVGQADYLKWCGGCSAEVAQVTAESGLRLNCFRAFLIQTATGLGSIMTYGYGSIPINTIFRGMNIHLPAILMFTRGTRFSHTAILWSTGQDILLLTAVPLLHCGNTVESSGSVSVLLELRPRAKDQRRNEKICHRWREKSHGCQGGIGSHGGSWRDIPSGYLT